MLSTNMMIKVISIVQWNPFIEAISNGVLTEKVNANEGEIYVIGEECYTDMDNVL